VLGNGSVTSCTIVLENGLNQNEIEISGSHGGDYEDDSLLGYWAVLCLMETVSTSETSVNIFKITLRNIPED
jgi:hypothetical protein